MLCILIVITDEFYAYTESDSAFLNATARGDMNSLRWEHSSEVENFNPETDRRNTKHPDEENYICNVYYASLNFRDIMLASGKLHPDAIKVQ